MKDNLSRLLPTIQREIQEVAERRERGRLEHEIRRLQKFDAIGRLAAGIAHDFNNALGVILGWAQLGCDEVADGSPLQKKLRVIIDQAQRSTGLTSQLLSFARGKVLQPRNLRLNHLVSETACFLNGVIGEAIEMEMSLTSGPNDIFGDPTQVGQILVNICLNARDAMPKGGRLLIETQTVKINEEFTPPYPHPVPGRYVLLSVSDTGMGMDPATLDHIFEPFLQPKRLEVEWGLDWLLCTTL